MVEVERGNIDVVSNGPSEDTGLRCDGCGYNLTGLTEERCPECGLHFDCRIVGGRGRWKQDLRVGLLAGAAMVCCFVSGCSVYAIIHTSMSPNRGGGYILPSPGGVASGVLVLAFFQVPATIVGVVAVIVGRRIVNWPVFFALVGAFLALTLVVSATATALMYLLR